MQTEGQDIYIMEDDSKGALVENEIWHKGCACEGRSIMPGHTQEAIRHEDGTLDIKLRIFAGPVCMKCGVPWAKAKT